MVVQSSAMGSATDAPLAVMFLVFVFHHNIAHYGVLLVKRLKVGVRVRPSVCVRVDEAQPVQWGMDTQKENLITPTY